MQDRYLVYDFDQNGLSALHWACKRNDLKMAKKLCKNFYADVM